MKTTVKKSITAAVLAAAVAGFLAGCMLMPPNEGGKNGNGGSQRQEQPGPRR